MAGRSGGIEVVARRVDAGARWRLEAVGMPDAHLELGDLVAASRAMRALLAQRLGRPAHEIELQILLA